MWTNLFPWPATFMLRRKISINWRRFGTSHNGLKKWGNPWKIYMERCAVNYKFDAIRIRNLHIRSSYIYPCGLNVSISMFVHHLKWDSLRRNFKRHQNNEIYPFFSETANGKNFWKILTAMLFAQKMVILISQSRLFSKSMFTFSLTLHLWWFFVLKEQFSLLICVFCVCE